MEAAIKLETHKLDSAKIIENLSHESWSRLKAFNPITLKSYLPKSAKNSFNISINDPSKYKEVFNIFDQIKEYIQVTDKREMVNSTEIGLVKAFVYGEGDYIKQHNDLGDLKIKDEIYEVCYSCLLYLNEVEGGELVLPDNNIVIKPASGELIVFTARIQHKVNEINSGKRYGFIYRLFRKK